MVWLGVRTFEAIMSTSASLRSPRLQILTQGNCSPSW